MRKIVRVFFLSIAMLVLFLVGCDVKFDYHITFMVEGEEYAYVGTDKKEIAMPKDPKKEHYIFDGWFWEDGKEFTLLSIGDQPLTEENNYKVYAKWLGEECPFTYGYNQTIEGVVRYGDKIEVEIPTRPNYVFTGYYLGEKQITDEHGNGLEPWYYTENKTLTPKWAEGEVKITFYAETSVNPANLSVRYLSKMGTLPTPANRNGYDFVGWYTQKNGKGEKITANTVCNFTTYTTLYAYWSPKSYTAYIDWGEGNGVASYSFTWGTPFTPPTPTVVPTGKRIDYWYSMENSTIWQAGEDILINRAGDINLYVAWELATYTLTFVYDGANSPYTLQVHYGLYFDDPPAPPEKTGYSFVGWYTQPTGGEKVNVYGRWEREGSLTVYPQYAQEEYEVTFLVPEYNGTLPTLRYHYGDTLSELPMDIVVPGKRLTAWWDGTTVDILYTPTSTMPSYDLRLEGVWEEYYENTENVRYTKLTGTVATQRVYDFDNDRICVLNGNQVDIYDGTTAKKLSSISQTSAVCIDAYDNRLAIAYGQTVAVYDLSTYALLKEISVGSNMISVKITDAAVIASANGVLNFYDLSGTLYKTNEGVYQGTLAINREDNLAYRLSMNDEYSCTISSYAIGTGEKLVEVGVVDNYSVEDFYFDGRVRGNYGWYDKDTLERLGRVSTLPSDFKVDDTASNADDGHCAEKLLYEDESYAVVQTYYWENQWGESEDDFYYRTLRLFDKVTNTYVDEMDFQCIDYNGYPYATVHLQAVEYRDGKIFFSNREYAGVWTIKA